MNNRRIILESKFAMSMVVWSLLVSCTSGTAFIGTYSFCNESGYYTEISFLSPTDLVVCHEVQPDGKRFTYGIKGDSMFTYNLDGHIVSECRIVSASPEKIEIATTEGDSIYHFDYVLISARPLLSHPFPDTLTSEYKTYKNEYDQRRSAKSCLKIPEIEHIKLEDIDTVFDDF